MRARLPRRLRCLFLLLACLAGASARAGEAQPNVVLFVIDTLRADRLGAYGNARAATPVLDAFAADAVLFERAHAPAPQTAPSHASLFTSTYPAVHGIWNDVPDDAGAGHPRLGPEAVTLAETLAGHGWATAAVADGGWVTGARGFDQGFEVFDSVTHGAADRVARACAWLETRDDDRPFFLFVHTYEVHAPHLPPEGSEDRFAPDYAGPLRGALAAARREVAANRGGNPLLSLHVQFFRPLLEAPSPADVAFLMALYDAELAEADAAFGVLRGCIERTAGAGEAIVAVTADHGEEFGEHGRFGHFQVFDETIRIPLLVRTPGGARGVRRRDAVDLVDLMPSILAATGVPAPPGLQGRVIDLGAPTGDDEPRVLVAEINHPEPQLAVRRGATTVVLSGAARDRGRVLRRRRAGGLDDLTGTPRGARLLAWARRVARGHQRRADHYAATIATSRGATPGATLSTEQVAQLRALGYLE